MHAHAPPLQVHSGAQPPPHIEPSQYWPSTGHGLLSFGGVAGQVAWGQPGLGHPPLLLPVLEPPLELLPLLTLPPLLAEWPPPVGGPMISVLPPHAAAARAKHASQLTSRISRQ